MTIQLHERPRSSLQRETERRRFSRIHLQVPLFIRGVDVHGNEFLELAKTLDISCSGARLISPRSLQSQEIVSLTVPAPLSRSPEVGGYGTPPISARVRRLELSGEMELVAVEFLRPLE